VPGSAQSQDTYFGRTTLMVRPLCARNVPKQQAAELASGEVRRALCPYLVTRCSRAHGSALGPRELRRPGAPGLQSIRTTIIHADVGIGGED